MTAEEFEAENIERFDSYYEMMTEFAKLKCMELLEIVAEKVKTKEWSYPEDINWIYEVRVDKDSILNAVDLDEFIR